jgi:hypothetical protein
LPVRIESEGQRLLVELLATSTVRQVAATAHVRPASISEWARAVCVPRDEQRRQLADWLGIGAAEWDHAPSKRARQGPGAPQKPTGLRKALLAARSAACDLQEAIDEALEALP